MSPEVESLRVQNLWLLKKALPSREDPDMSLSILKIARHANALCAIISPKCGSTLNTRRNDFIRTYIERTTSHKRKNRFVSHCEG